MFATAKKLRGAGVLGLNIQIANSTGLAKRLARIDAIYDATATPEQRAAIARQEFTADT